jgi:glycosyltransferase involved in cell wall biosynthesis
LSNGAGGEKWIEQMATHLKKEGVDVTIITTEYGSTNNLAIIKNLAEKNIPVMEMSNYKVMFKIPKIQCVKQVASILRKMDILYFNNAFALNEVFIYVLKKITNIKVVSGYHGTFPETGGPTRIIYHSLINRSVSRTFDAHHVLNKEREVLLRSWGYTNVYRIPNGVDTKFFSLRKKTGVGFTVLFAGSMNYQKGIDRFASIVERINEVEPKKIDVRFVIVGSGEMSYIAEKLKDRFINVTYMGYVDEQTLASVYATSHVFVSPSRFEEFPLSVIEAHASGTPVIASDIPGPREVVINGNSGFLVDSNDADELVKPILYLYYLWSSNYGEYQKYCLNARTIALNYDWDRVASEIKNLLTSII